MEEWRAVIGFEGSYEVSSLGALRRVSRGYHTRPGRVMKPSKASGGYLQVHLSNNDKRRFVLVHRLVAEAFIGPRPDGLEINHLDGQKAHNALTNLEYVTKTENAAHACRSGLYRSKLSIAAVGAIRSSDAPTSDLMRRYNMGRSQLKEIRAGTAWRHA